MSHAVSCASLENYQLLVRTRTHAWLGDEPPAHKGDGLGPSPFEQLLGALGSCINVTVVHFAGQSHIALTRLWVDLRDEWVGEGADEEYHIHVKLRVRGDFKDKDVQRLKRYADRCPVHQVLAKGAVIHTEIEEV